MDLRHSRIQGARAILMMLGVMLILCNGQWPQLLQGFVCGDGLIPYDIDPLRKSTVLKPPVKSNGFMHWNYPDFKEIYMDGTPFKHGIHVL
jgi:hypothetical protein